MEPFIGQIQMFGFNFPPRGWAFCDGQLLPIAQNTALFAIVGTTYGGDGRTTLGLPNLQGRAPMHEGNGPGLTPRRLGEVGGVSTVTLSEAQMPQHTHTLAGNSRAATTGNPAGAQLADAAPFTNYGPLRDNENLAPQAVANTGGSGAHNNLQPYLSLNFTIALVGLFPSRS